MKQQLHLQVPTPCHEDWGKMNPTEQGRFCASCSKQVVDFTLMTDTEIRNHLTKANGNTCGRFSNDQLNRALAEPVKENKKRWKWLLACVSSLFVLLRSNAQVKEIKPAVPAAIASKGDPNQVITVGGGILTTPSRTISGRITDKEGNGISSASVLISKTKIGTTADAQGYFSLQLPENVSNCTLSVSSIGYEGKEIVVSVKQSKQNIQLALSEALSGDVVIVAKPAKTIHVTGIVTDELTEKPVPGASIYSENYQYLGVADDKGKFSIYIPASADSMVLNIEAIGYEKESGKIALKKNNEVDVFVTMKQNARELPPVTVTSYPFIQCTTVTLGMVSAERIDTSKEKPLAALQFKATAKEKEPTKTINALNIYPNPVSKNARVSIVVPEKGEWKIQFISNNGTILKLQSAMIPAKMTAVHFQLPVNTVSGIYYIRLINSKGEITHTGKLVVQ